MRLACALLALITAIVAPAAAQAQPPSARVHVAGDAGASAALEEVMRELLRRAGVELVFERVERVDAATALAPDPDAAPALARAWIDLRGERAALYLVDGAWKRALVRSIEQSGRSAEVVREEIAHVVQTAADTLLAGAPLGQPREEVERQLGIARPRPSPPPAPAPAPVQRAWPRPLEPELPPPAPPAWRLGAGLYYEGQGYAAEQVIVHGPGIALDVDAPAWTLGPGVELTAQYRIPFTVDGELAGVRLQSAVLRLHARLTLWRASDVAFFAAAGAGIDVLHLEPHVAEGARARALPARTRVAPLVRPSLAARLRLFGDTALWLSLAGDVDLIGVRYVVQQGSETIPFLEPLRFRPSIGIGLATTLAGGRMFPPVIDQGP